MEYIGSSSDCYNNAPLLSNSCNEQWVVKEGYYFWPDSKKHAHFWGDNHYQKCYIIIDYNLNLKQDEIYDLVGNQAHIDEFTEILKIYMEATKLVQSKVYVYQLIEYIRKKVKFPYLAIKVENYPGFRKSEHKLKYSKNKNQSDFLFLNKRIQLCLFKEAKNTITKNEIIHKQKD
jgi:hypothetical protein